MFLPSFCQLKEKFWVIVKMSLLRNYLYIEPNDYYIRIMRILILISFSTSYFLHPYYPPLGVY
jgi:hypothetical protein